MKAWINGKEAGFEPGDTILTAAKRAGCHIPSLCEMADIHHAPATCRICMVEVRRQGQAENHVVTACNTPMEDGISVFTRTKKVRDMQKLQTELLLADHDQDCATCVRHGDCELQDVAQFVGLQRSRFSNPALTKGRPVDHSAPSLVRDMGKCIRCFRCVAVCREIQGIDALTIQGLMLARCGRLIVVPRAHEQTLPGPRARYVPSSLASPSSRWRSVLRLTGRVHRPAPSARREAGEAP